MQSRKNEMAKSGQALFSVFSSIIVLCLSLVVGFFLPKYVSIETFAAYKTYTLYSGFVGFFHLGFINGIYLKYGSYGYNELPKNRFRGYTLFLIVFQTFVQTIIISFSLLLFPEIRKQISPFFFVAYNIAVINVNCYFYLVDQFTQRFIVDGAIQLLQQLICMVGFSYLIIKKTDYYVPYLVIVSLSNVFASVLLIIENKEIVFGCDRSFDYKDFAQRISRGFYVMISEYMGLFIVGIDSIIVNVFFSKSEFSFYSFAVSIVSVMYQINNVISKIVFPYLKRLEGKKLLIIYDPLKVLLTFFAYLVAGIAFFAGYLIRHVIPKYEESIVLIHVLAITTILKGVHDLAFANYFKVFSLEKKFMRVNVFVLVLGVISDLLAYLLFNSMTAIAVASVICFGIWYLVSDITLKRTLCIPFGWEDAILICFMLLYCMAMFIAPQYGFIVFYSALIISFCLYASKHKTQFSCFL